MVYNSNQITDKSEDPFAHLENIDANPELQERFGENRENFEKNYRKKLDSYLGVEGEDLLGKISGKFEQNGDIIESVNSAVESVNNLDKSDFVKESILSLLINKETDHKIVEKIELESIDSFEPTEREKKLNHQEGLLVNSKENLQNQLGINEDDLEEILLDTDNNKEQAKALVYNTEFIEPFLGDEPSAIQENRDFFQSEEVQGDLDDILGKFVLNGDALTIDGIYQEGGIEGVNQINNSLNEAFDMKLSIVTEGKMNYAQEAFDNILTRLHEGNPFEKISCFEELKQLVNNREGMGGAKQSKEFKNKLVNNKLKLGLTEERFNEVKELLIQANNKSIDSVKSQKNLIEEIKLMEGKDNENEGDIFANVGELEIGSNKVKEGKESTV